MPFACILQTSCIASNNNSVQNTIYCVCNEGYEWNQSLSACICNSVKSKIVSNSICCPNGSTAVNSKCECSSANYIASDANENLLCSTAVPANSKVIYTYKSDNTVAT